MQIAALESLQKGYGQLRIVNEAPALSERLRSRREKLRLNSGSVPETFTRPRLAARQRARAYFADFPAEAYMTMIEHYRPVADDRIEFHNANVANSRLSYAGDPSFILALK
jgi:hypothetical protein